jgi:hypothetical protein
MRCAVLLEMPGPTKPAALSIFGSSDNAFGTPGAGGSFGFADPGTGIGYGYVMNKLGFHPVSDPRELALRHVCSTTSSEPGPKLETVL